MQYIKQGDTIPITGQITVTDGDSDITNAQNFAEWSVNCRAQTANWGADVPITVEADGSFSGELPSSETALIPDGSRVEFDLRIRDPDGTVTSSPNFAVRIIAPVAGVPT